MGRWSDGRKWLWAAVLCLPALAMAAAPIQLRTTAQEGSDPKFVQGKGRIVGLCIDIMRAVEQVDPGLRFVGDQAWKPLIRAFAELASGQEDVQCAVQRTPEREKLYRYVGPGLYTIEYHFLARADDNLNIRNWDDVRLLAPNNLVLVNRGYAARDIINGAGGIEVDDRSPLQELNLQKLLAGRGRLYFHRSPGLQRLLERTGTVGKIKILPQVMYSAKLYFVVNRQLDQRISERLANALYQLEKTGELERLARKWD